MAAAGRRVALVSSGDAGIYGMAALVLELLEQREDPAWRRILLTFSPGVSALQAAAARAGAPLGHDFCAISLSDLLTPWAVIERRLARRGRRRLRRSPSTTQCRPRRRERLVRAKEILLAGRARRQRPVILARNLGRAGEALRVTSLAAFEPASVDMLTLSSSAAAPASARGPGTAGTCVYTPRG